MPRKRIDPKLPIAPTAGDDPAVPLMKPDRFMDRLVRRLNELFLEQSGGGVEILDEGVDLGFADTLNFVGADVTATLSNTTGTIDISFTGGSGATLPSMSVTAGEAVSANNLINIYSDGGVFKGRKAKASAAGYEAYGWADADTASGATLTVNFLGKVTSSGLTPGPVFLSDTAGLATSTCPTGSGHVAQQVGVSDSATEFAFEWQPAVLLAAAHTVSTGGSSTSVEITTSTTITISNVVGAGLLTMIGGGGGGKSTAASAVAGGGGGGSGEYCIDYPVPLTPGETVTITIGAGGSAGSDGGTTSFACAAGTFSVLGGKGAPSGTGGAGGGPKGGSGGAAGNPPTAGVMGTAESPVHFGGGGGGGGVSAGANSAVGVGAGAPGRLTGGAAGTGSASGGSGGGGAATIWGNGGGGGSANGAGNAAGATAYGAGGGGGGGNSGSGQAGGAGANGYAFLTYVS